MLTRRLLLGLGSLLALPSTGLAALITPASQGPATSRSVLVRISNVSGLVDNAPTSLIVSMQGVRAGDRVRVFRDGGYPDGYTVTLSEKDLVGQSATVTFRGKISSETDSHLYSAEVLDRDGRLLASGRSLPFQESI